MDLAGVTQSLLSGGASDALTLVDLAPDRNVIDVVEVIRKVLPTLAYTSGWHHQLHHKSAIKIATIYGERFYYRDSNALTRFTLAFNQGFSARFYPIQGISMMAKKRFVLWLLATLLYLAVVSVSANPVGLATKAGSEFHKIEAKLKKGGKLPVIVELNVDWRPEGRLARQLARERQVSGIKRAQERVQLAISNIHFGRTKRFKHLPFMALEVDQQILERLSRNPYVKDISEDSLSQPTLVASSPLVGANTAWELGYSGDGQAVVILDTGVESSHSFFGGSVAHEACFSSSNSSQGATTACPNGLESQVGPGAAAPPDENISGRGHGTHVAGISAGRSSSFSGVARGADIIAIQVFSKFPASSCSGRSACMMSYTSDQMLALEHVYSSLRNSFAFEIAAVNMSLGGADSHPSYCDASLMKAAIDQLRSVNIATVVASGNDGFIGGLSSPACISSAISVGSTTKSDTVSRFSNSASFLDLLAPGETINSSTLGNGFGLKMGTSMAAPQVTGAIAVLKSKISNATVAQVVNALVTSGLSVTDTRNGVTKPRIRVDQALSVLTATGPGHLQVEGPSFLSITGKQGGLFTPASQSYILTNIGGAPLSWEVRISQEAESLGWQSGSQMLGMLSAGQSVTVDHLVPNEANSLSVGRYTSTFDFVNLSNNIGNFYLVDVLLNVQEPGPDNVALVQNDKFNNSIFLPQSSGSITGSNISAELESQEPQHGGNAGGSSAWWSWTAPADGEATFDTLGSNFDTLLAAYVGTTLADLQQISSNNDISDSSNASRIPFSVVSGTTYYIAVDGVAGTSGDILLNWSFAPSISEFNPLTVTPATGLSSAGNVGGPFSPNSVQYSLTNVSSESITYEVSNLPEWLSISSASGAISPGASTSVTLTVNTTAESLTAGNYQSDLRFNDIVRAQSLLVNPLSVANDDFSSATLISGSTASIMSSNIGTTSEPEEPLHAGISGGKSVWWRWVAPTDSLINVETTGSDFDTLLGIYTGPALNTLTMVAANDDSGSGLQSKVVYLAQAGATYHIAVDGYGGEQGAIKLSILPDFDGDGIPDVSDSDDDNDGMSDVWEEEFGLNPKDPSDALDDNDEDGLTNLREFGRNTNPTASDTDGDGFSDGYEIDFETDPTDADDLPVSSGKPWRWALPGSRN